MTHGDLALDAGVDFLAVAEHRLIPVRVRSEWSRLKGKGLSSIWAPASQDSSRVGNAGVGVVSLRGAPLALPTFVTARFKSFFDCGRAVRCLLLLASGRFLHLCVLYGYQGADTDAEQLALTDQLFDAALGELYVAALGQPCLLVGDFNVEPTKIPCLAKGISAGLWVDFGEACALAAGLQLVPTCKRSWEAVGGHRRDFMVGCPLAAAALLSCNVQPGRWIAPHLAVRALFDYGRWDAWVAQPVRCTPLWPASWLPIVDKTRGSKSAEVQRIWEVYDERLQFMSRRDAFLLDQSLGLDDVSMAWTVWSRAAEAALADAYRFESRGVGRSHFHLFQTHHLGSERCTVSVPAVYLPKKRPGLRAAGPQNRILFGWPRLLYTASSGIWIFRGALRGSHLMPALASCIDWAVGSTYRTAWAVQPCCRCSYSFGSGPAVGPQASGNWEFLRGLWRAVAPLMAPWCADRGSAHVCEFEFLRRFGFARPMAQR